ncbi:MAG: S-layer protein, partial [Fuerstia sp.]|nr:S-layer protein [Fuerstiella sp.]
MIGQNARKQLIVTGVYSSGQRHDLTHDVTYSVDAPAVLNVDAEGLVVPTADGTATITAKPASGESATLVLTTSRCAEELPVNFENEIVPIFTKLGCNAGGCHGKADGQNGFKLSLLGFYPKEDYEYLVYEDRGRRVFPADPDFSLLLQKPGNILPHGGGQRMSPGSYEWELIARWIRQGMPYGAETDPTLERIESIPAVREMNFKSKQQLAVIAHYSDGSTRDVTRLASYEANHSEMALSNAKGRITIEDIPGEVAIMVRFQGSVGVFRAVIP